MDNIKNGTAKTTKTISGVIKRVIFQNAENGFTILNILSNDRFITASGIFFEKPLSDSKVKLTGEFIHHKKYGYQFNFNRYEISLSNTESAIINYLSSNIFKGIGKFTAKQIYEKFKEKTLDVIDNEPEKLKEVSGIGSVKLSTILDGLKESYGLRKAVMFFKPYQFSDYQIKAVYNQFKDKAVAIAEENPFLFTEIKGIGFKKADIMAEKLGIKKNDPNRIKEAVKYIINQICENSGNCYVYYRHIKDGLKDVIEDVDVDESELKGYLNDLIREKKILTDNKDISVSGGNIENDAVSNLNDVKSNAINLLRIYPPIYYYSEIGIAKELKRLTAENDFDRIQPVEELKKFIDSQENKMSLTEEQKTAALNALRHKISIISGGPGTGKSTIIKTITGLFDGKRTALTSLSGKAAQRLSDIINANNKNKNEPYKNNLDISTIHRLLKAQYDRQTNESFFTYNENNRLPHDLIVIDEMSMTDVIIFYKLLKAVKDGATLVLVGDANQIPSVSPGDVLKDLIYPDAFFPVTFLTKVFRQNEGGLINLNAHNLLNNKRFITDKTGEGKKEFTIKYRKGYDTAVTGKSELLNDFILFVKKVRDKRTKGISRQDDGPVEPKAFDDIQVLTPMRRGELGYNNLNNILQDIFNPSGMPANDTAESAGGIFICNGTQFRLHDRVIQRRNNYNLDVFNGDAGYIYNIDHTEKTLSVDFSGTFNEIVSNDAKKIIKYNFLDVYENIMLSYALSIHKAQGSEFNNVIVLFHQTHYLMLKKNLLYTAITRGKKNVIIFGTFKAFGIAMNSKEEKRNSGLRDRLQTLLL
ncbi:ATP-dependent RecD-like DNA helicase [Candidatus Acidulodesulfobacterium sp. H_13]|uniref:SF1B family DNA helicase RecD2 n=1 Tax=Candidatus Acidulodesulfobacterium sp. H_13 TaxID=3395470 RepID=UPI003AF9BAF7